MLTRWGIWGATTIAREWMVDAIRLAGGEVVSVCSRDRDRGTAFAREMSIPRAFTDPEGFLSDDIDCVYIGTINSFHYDQCLAAAAAGKHVFCDKPLALSLEDAAGMIDACERAGVILAVNHHLRNAVPHRTMRDMIGSGRIGRPLAARVVNASCLPPHLQGWRIQDSQSGAGVIFDLTVHDADLLRVLLDDEPLSVSATAQHSGFGARGIEDAVMGVIEFRSGLQAQFHDAFTTPFAEMRVEVHGSRGSLIATDTLRQRPGGTLMLRTASGDEEIDLAHENLYLRGIAAFMAAADGSGTPLAGGIDGFASLSVALAARKSADTGRSVSIPPLSR